MPACLPGLAAVGSLVNATQRRIVKKTVHAALAPQSPREPTKEYTLNYVDP